MTFFWSAYCLLSLLMKSLNAFPIVQVTVRTDLLLKCWLLTSTAKLLEDIFWICKGLYIMLWHLRLGKDAILHSLDPYFYNGNNNVLSCDQDVMRVLYGLLHCHPHRKVQKERSVFSVAPRLSYYYSSAALNRRTKHWAAAQCNLLCTELKWCCEAKMIR